MRRHRQRPPHGALDRRRPAQTRPETRLPRRHPLRPQRPAHRRRLLRHQDHRRPGLPVPHRTHLSIRPQRLQSLRQDHRPALRHARQGRHRRHPPRTLTTHHRSPRRPCFRPAGFLDVDHRDRPSDVGGVSVWPPPTPMRPLARGDAAESAAFRATLRRRRLAPVSTRRTLLVARWFHAATRGPRKETRRSDRHGLSDPRRSAAARPRDAGGADDDAPPRPAYFPRATLGGPGRGGP
mmetsp:Transcript_10224/g.25987  ORF Transcript_10224/g.25987 Transcript_10224/m.25987 type:complete len:237 (-) Transcript_10224:27-737(-)